jgi:hypothetical protein
VLDCCIKVKNHANFNTDRFLSLIAPFGRTADRTLAKLLIAKMTLVAWDGAVPLLEQIATRPDQDQSICAFARRYLDWILAETADQNRP